MVNLYLDGCSYTYGLGLEKYQTLEYLFGQAGYKVTNLSRPGKSNMAISLDTHKNLHKHDVYVIGFTYSSRFYINFRDFDLDLINTRFELNGTREDIEDAYVNLHKSFYTLYDHSYWHLVSDMLVNNTISAIKLSGKKVFSFSWEKRLSSDIYYPIILPTDRISIDDPHMNARATKKLFDLIQNQLGDA